jgi:DNA repair protein RecO (recombination protein O)
MPGLYRDSGVVLRTIKLGEADRIVTVMTQAHGKVRAVAKGVRRTQSRFGARLEPASHVALQLYAGRDLDTVTQCETIESNRALREGYTLLTHTVPMLEAVDQIVHDRQPNPALYRMLTGALRTLATRQTPLVTPAFFWKVLSLEGYHPMLDACARCGTQESKGEGGELTYFDLVEGGTVCTACGFGGAHRLSPEALALLRRVLGGGLNGALAEPSSTATSEVERLALGAIEHLLERRLRSATLL